MTLKTKHSIVILFALIFSGCAAMPFGGLPKAAEVYPVPGFPTPYKDYKGVLHIHTRYSSTSTGSFEEVADAAQEAGLDFVVVTDHNTLAPARDKKEGLYGKTLVLAGTEVTGAGDHFEIFGVRDDTDLKQPKMELLEDVQDQKGAAFACHADFSRSPWKDRTLASKLTGMEIYNLGVTIGQQNLFWVGVKSLFYPRKYFIRSLLKRPETLLGEWDKILAGQTFVGVAGSDAHERYRVFGTAVDSYVLMFTIVQTHVLAKDSSKEALLEAFRKGRSYIGFDAVKPVRNFLFMAETPKKRAVMGDRIKYREGLLLRVFLPEDGNIHVLKDGKLWQTAKGKNWSFAVEGPGVYRVEVYDNGKIWILSNPIYVQ